MMVEFHSEWVGIVEIDGFRRCAPTSVDPRRGALTTATAGDLRSACCFCIPPPSRASSRAAGSVDGFRRCAPTSVGPRRGVLTTATAGDLRSACCFCIPPPSRASSRAAGYKNSQSLRDRLSGCGDRRIRTDDPLLAKQVL